MPQRTTFTEASVKRFKLPPPGAQIDHFEKLKRGLTLTLRISYGGTQLGASATTPRSTAR